MGHAAVDLCYNSTLIAAAEEVTRVNSLRAKVREQSAASAAATLRVTWRTSPGRWQELPVTGMGAAGVRLQPIKSNVRAGR